jgi:hypothetical protein
LIKGFAVARLYDDISVRQYVDIDFAVDPLVYEEAREALKTSRKGVLVDLHKGLRHHDTLPWEKLFANSRLIGDGPEKIRVLSEEDHLRVLCVHWLTDGGESKERLWDIYYAVQNRSEDFDWDRCLGVVERNRRRWILTVIGLTNRYLGLEIKKLGFPPEELEPPLWLINEIEKQWEKGIRIVPLEQCLGDRKMLWEQIKKRIPPNPIHATIDLNGEFDDSPRYKYQLKNLLYRIPGSFRRVKKVLFR